MPPEFNTARLMMGAGPAPMLQAAAGWEALAISLETQADELAASLAALTSVWSGSASERAVASTKPMVVWLRTVSLQAQKRALQAIAQANAYTAAMATTPPLAEIEQNHITHGVLEATNFFWVNTIPIALNEADYFIRMWNQAAGAMDVYQAETMLNLMFEMIAPPKPIVIPGVAEGAASAAVGAAAVMAPAAAVRNAAIATVSAQGKVESAALHAGQAAGQASMAEQRAQGAVQRADNHGQQVGQQGQQVQMGMQMASQLGSTLGQLPQQASQMVMQPMQQLTQPLQQVTSMIGQMSGLGSDKPQIGLIGASPFSNHPLAGGSGPGSGAGLVRAASLPGAGGTAPRTPLLANLIGETKPVVAPGAAAGAGAMGLAPVGAGGGGMGPMGGMGQRGKGGASKRGLTAPAPLPQEPDENEDDW